MVVDLEARYFSRLRMDVALVYDGQRRTLYEGAKALGKPSGSIRRTVRRMHADGALCANDPEPSRGTLYWLNPDAQEALVKALEQTSAPGTFVEGQRLLEVEIDNRLALQRVLSRRELGHLVCWAAELDGANRWLLAIVGRASRLQVDRLSAALTDIGARCASRRIGDIYDRGEWQRAGLAIEEAVS